MIMAHSMNGAQLYIMRQRLAMAQQEAIQRTIKAAPSKQTDSDADNIDGDYIPFEENDIINKADDESKALSQDNTELNVPSKNIAEQKTAKNRSTVLSVDKQDLRRAVIMSEILSAPLSKRRRK